MRRGDWVKPQPGAGQLPTQPSPRPTQLPKPKRLGTHNPAETESRKSSWTRQLLYLPNHHTRTTFSLPVSTTNN